MIATADIQLMTVEEVAEFLRLHPSSVRRSLIGRIIPAVRVGVKRGRLERRHLRAGRIGGRWATEAELRSATSADL